MSIPYTTIDSSRQSSVTALLFDELHTIDDSHPHFGQVLSLLKSGTCSENEIHDLISQPTSATVSQKMRQLSSRVSYDGATIFFDDDPIHSTLVEHIKASLTDGTHSWEPLVKFLERQAANPSMTSRRELYDWLLASGLVIADDGRFIGYKGLDRNSHSVTHGGAYVNGTWVDGHVPNHIGSVISLDRSAVDDDRTQHCSAGLHVGSYAFAQAFSRDVIATVLVDPADVVSVPDDHGCEKLRTCRYEVVKTEKDNATYLGRYSTVTIDDITGDIDDDDDDDEPRIHDFA